MKITITVGGTPREITLTSISGKTAEKGWTKTLALEKAEGEQQELALKEYLAWRDSVALQKTGLTAEEWADLTVDDRSLVTEYLSNQLQKELGFTKRS